MDEYFDLYKILANSVYYPASGVDATDIKYGSWLSQSFVHADYSSSREEVYKAMQNDFHKVGFDLVGIKAVSKKEFTPKI